MNGPNCWLSYRQKKVGSISDWLFLYVYTNGAHREVVGSARNTVIKIMKQILDEKSTTFKDRIYVNVISLTPSPLCLNA